MVLKWLYLPVLVLITSGCTLTEDYRSFSKSHGKIHKEMLLSEVFEQSLADYLILLKTKNITGQTSIEKQPVSETCERYILDIRYSRANPTNPGKFDVYVFCNINLLSSKQMIPKQSFANKESFLKALSTTYDPWAKSMKFKVASPPKFIGGVYDHYEFTTNQRAMVSNVSSID